MRVRHANNEKWPPELPQSNGDSQRFLCLVAKHVMEKQAGDCDAGFSDLLLGGSPMFKRGVVFALSVPNIKRSLVLTQSKRRLRGSIAWY